MDAAAYGELASRDEVMRRLLAEHDAPDPFAFPDGGRTTGDDFSGMLLHIIGQQISTAVALVIFDRLTAATGGRPAPGTVIALGADRLRSLGMSHAKASYLLDLSERVAGGRLDFDLLSRLSDDDARAALQEVKGVGPWSAEMFLIHQLRRPDILPAGDLGIRAAVRRFYLPERLPTIAETREVGTAWAPYRTYAAALLWRGLASA